MIIRSLFPAFLLLAVCSAPPAAPDAAANPPHPASGSSLRILAAPQPPAPDETDLKALDAIEGIVQLFRQPPGDIWPGFSLDDRPFIVYRPGRWALLVGYLSDTAGFGPYPLNWPHIGHPVRFHQGEYEGFEGQLFFDFPLDDTTTVAVGLPDDIPEMSGLEDMSYEAMAFGYIVHEAFHQYQYDAFGEIPWEREERYPILDAENNALALLEVRALMGALRALEAGDTAECERQTRTFVAVRTHRWNTSPPFVRKFEQGLELNEGTAKYVEVRALSAVKELQYHSDLPSRIPLPERLANLTAEGLTLADFEGRLESAGIPPEDMPRNRIYAVGAAQGLLLDYFSVDWKESAQLAGPDFEMAWLLRERLGVDDDALESLLSEAMEASRFASVLADAESRIEKYVAGYKRAMAAFKKLDGTKVSISMKRSGVGRSRVSSERKWLMDDGTVQLCRKYDLYSLSNDDLLFMIKDSALLEKNDWEEDVRTVTVKVREEPAIEIDGEQLALVPNRRYSFDRIEVTGGPMEFRASVHGTVRYSKDGVTVDLLQH